MAQARPVLIRKPNFMPAEVDMLVEHVIRHQDLLYGPQSRTVGAYRKEQIWRGIRHAVNSVFHHNRSIGELMHKWRDMRRLVKRKQARRLAEGERSDIIFSSSEQLILGTILKAAVGGVGQLNTMCHVGQGGPSVLTQLGNLPHSMQHTDNPLCPEGVVGQVLDGVVNGPTMPNMIPPGVYIRRRRWKPVNTWNSLRRRSSSGWERSRRIHWLKCNVIGSRTAVHRTSPNPTRIPVRQRLLQQGTGLLDAISDLSDVVQQEASSLRRTVREGCDGIQACLRDLCRATEDQTEVWREMLQQLPAMQLQPPAAPWPFMGPWMPFMGPWMPPEVPVVVPPPAPQPVPDYPWMAPPPPPAHPEMRPPPAPELLLSLAIPSCSHGLELPQAPLPSEGSLSSGKSPLRWSTRGGQSKLPDGHRTGWPRK
ncbi:myb-related transcription factor, partner of profilin-like [Rhinatrema bivittatum]|uniref:myb-related transcription factor, partner of profilin-like n=1 Tax=Rhinatrema bivittatum TaxID=194408 RepID=UPI00112CEA3E|nr:myb-related transcription factor, partner of profilin-like [Rhinatrema bivittatum]